MNNITHVEASTISDAWFQFVYHVLDDEKVYKQKIQRGSYEGQIRRQFYGASVSILHPDQDIVPVMPVGLSIPPPTDMEYIERYFTDYLMRAELQPTEQYCYSYDTEVLTDEGWKLFSDLNKTERVLTINTDTKKLEYQAPIGYTKSKYKGKMFSINNKAVNLLVSPHHTMLSADYMKDTYSLRKIETILTKPATRMLRTGIWEGVYKKYFYLPGVEYNNNTRYNSGKERRLNMNDFLAFLGIWVAEGSLRPVGKTNNYTVVITKKNVVDQKIIFDMVTKIFPNAFVYKKDIIINDKQLYCYLEPINGSNNKRVPREFMCLSKEQLKILFKWMYFGDGNKSGGVGSNSMRYRTISKRLADDVQEIALKIGTSANIKSYDDNYSYSVIIYHKNHQMPHVLKRQITEVDYDNFIYCVEVPKHHTLYVRRCGILSWSGNTYGQRIWVSMNEVIKMLKETPFSNQINLQIGQPDDVYLDDPPCVTDESYVITDKGVVHPSEVNIGDEILTHKGRMRKVTQVYKRKTSVEQSFINMIEKGGRLNANFTNEHPIEHVKARTCSYTDKSICKSTCTHKSKLLNSGESVSSRSRNGNRCELFYKKYDLKWEKMSSNDINFLPITKTEYIDVQSSDILKDVFRLYGYYLGNGNLRHPHFSVKEQRYKGYGIIFSFNKRDEDKIQDCVDIMRDAFNKVKYKRYELKNCVRLQFHSKRLYTEFKQMFYKVPENPNKGKGNGVYTTEYKVIPTEFIFTSLDLQRELLKGYLLTDGYTRSNGQKSIYVTSVRLEILFGIMINNVHGHYTKNYVKKSKSASYIDGREIKSKTDGVVLIFSEDSTQLLAVNDRWLRRNVSVFDMAIKRSDTVYNFDVEEDNSYVVNGYIPAHNCLRIMDLKVIPREKFGKTENVCGISMTESPDNNVLTMSVYFRSWDLWAGFPANLGGFELLKEYICGETGLYNGPMYAYSAGLHLYEMYDEIARIRAYK